ncbi:MAG: hypothetical protein NC548_63890 [Lachnospiraceae bacterium]|nr:hypothetical protein [Lachnospiraceae bacterium]
MNIKKSFLMLPSYILIICCVFFTGCNHNNNTVESNLIAYRETKSSEIISYKDSKLDNNFYCEAEYLTLNSICETCINEIYKSKDKTTIDLVCYEAKRDMDLVDTKMNETEFLQQFDLSDPKISSSNQGTDFCVDRVTVILKKSVTNLKINLEDFCLDNGERIDLYDFGNYDNPNYRHMLTIYLKEHGTEKVVEAVTELNKLEFVRFACPVYIYGIQDD